ncbi:hypothetical protein N185_36085 [Sinorhizobium sp. GW3]|nr:hypothetical protein N185_36085 [Sinorhizobium sp. GW3]
MDEFTMSLLTSSPEDGIELAAWISWEVVKMVQPSREIRDRLVAVYQDDADSILRACQIIAINFPTVAAANGYWRHVSRP